MDLLPGHPHALDHDAYDAGVPLPAAMLALEAADPFWRTLGGSVEDPWGDGGETFRDRRRARELGIGANIYGGADPFGPTREAGAR